MSFFRKKTRKSVPKRSTFISYVNFPTSETMATPTTANPANPTYENLFDKPNGAVAESDAPPPNTYVNLPPQTDSSPVKSKGASASSSHPKLSPQQSDPCISGTNPYSAVVQVEGGEFTVTPGHHQGMDEAKLRLLVPEEECVRCKELGQLLAMWELGVSGLARNYSKILSHLNKAKEASMVLECRVKQKAEMNSSMAESKNLQRSTRGFRQSVYGGLTSTSAAEPNLAQQMYPKSQDQQPTPHEKQFNDLNTHLGEAIDVCQQLAAACFKSNQSSTGYSRLRRQPTMPNMPVTSRSTPTTSPHHRNILQSISEENPASSKRKHRKKPPLERTPSAPSDITSSTSSTMSQERTPEKGQAAKEDSESGSRQRAGSEETNARTLTGESFVTDEMTNSKLLDSPTRSHGSPAKSHDSPIKSAPESPLKASNHSAAVPPAIPSVPDSGTGSMMEIGNRDSILSTYSENDVKQVMSKLADLEEERLKLLETREKMYHENQEV